MAADVFAEFKAKQREGWAHFGPVESFTTPSAAHLVRFAEIRSGSSVLDIGTGTGVVAVTARRAGAKVTGMDLTPELLEHARENAAIAELEDIVWKEGDAEQLPFPDASFDVVVSQFGHMFAPRPELALKEMLRVLKPGGRLAFATWPPEHFVGKLFALLGKYAPPPPGVAPITQWGDISIVRDRLGTSVTELFFERGVMAMHALSPQHYRTFAERTVGPILKLVQALANEPDKLLALRRDLEALAASHLVDNVVRHDYLLTRARKT